MKTDLNKISKICKNCVYYEHLKCLKSLGQGECHRFPPAIRADQEILWPLVLSNDRCGEWMSKQVEIVYEIE